MPQLNAFSVLVCPLTKRTLKQAPEDLLKALNVCVKKKHLKNKGGSLILKPIENLYVCSDFRFGYVVEGKVPILIEEEAIELGFISDRDWQLVLKKAKSLGW